MYVNNVMCMRTMLYIYEGENDMQCIYLQPIHSISASCHMRWGVENNVVYIWGRKRHTKSTMLNIYEGRNDIQCIYYLQPIHCISASCHVRWGASQQCYIYKSTMLYIHMREKTTYNASICSQFTASLKAATWGGVLVNNVIYIWGRKW